jgi:hypothetical protein
MRRNQAAALTRKLGEATHHAMSGSFTGIALLLRFCAVLASGALLVVVWV